MLVLKRKPKESICIGGTEIEVIVLSMNGQSVRLGIAAPKNVVITRKEMLITNETNHENYDRI